ncbi:MAG: glycosyltransferase family 39 protein [Deltaproteobacteria bacterium]|nr:glycosyltransferase family 39 protein [Deltaproteobacteria bacterium]
MQTGNPGYFYYPSLMLYLDGGLMRLGWGAALDCTAALHPDQLFFVMRVISAIAGALWVPAAALLAYRASPTPSRRRAMVATAILAALAYLPAREAHFGTIDSALLLALTVALHRIQVLIEQPSRRAYLLAGAAWGLATSVKYNALGLAVPVLVAHWLVWKRGAAKLVDARVLGLALAALVAFVGTSPFLVLSWRDALAQFLTDLRVLHDGYPGFEQGTALGFYGTFALPVGLGLPMCIAAIVGLGVLVRRPQAWPLLAFGIASALSIATGKYTLVRYALVVVPTLIVCAGWALASIPRARVPLVAMLAVLVALPSLWRLIALDRALSLEDTRSAAAAWMSAHASSGASVVEDGYFGAPVLPMDRSGLTCPESGPRFRASAVHRYESMSVQQDLVNAAYANPPDYVVEREGLLKWYGRRGAWVPGLVEGRYELAQAWPVSLREPARFDELDAFYLPFDAPLAQTQPGPSIQIWKRR